MRGELAKNFILIALLALGACVAPQGNNPSPTMQTVQSQPGPRPAAVPVITPPPGAVVTGPRRAALLLPLSGPQAAVGQSLRNAALLAMQELAPASLELNVYDTAKGSTAAFEAARAAGAQLIIGPLFSADVQAIRGAAQAANLPVLALSSDAGIAGQNVYVMGFWPGAQVSRVSGFASSRGQRSLAALVPDDSYGQAVATALPPQSIVRLPAAAAPDQVTSALAPNRGRYDALLITADPAHAGADAAALQAQGLLTGQHGGVQLLGPGLWDDPSAMRQPSLTGGWYAAPDPEAHRAFVSRYARAFGDQPVRIASLAYDATALAAVLAGRGWPYAPPYLTQSQGFDGIDGLFRLRPDGLAERGLAILQLTPTGPRIIDPAPARF